MRILITCGPSYEPVDEVRRLTNFSTGELGVLLANRLLQAGHQVVCLKGEAATYPGKCEAPVVPFSTNDDLLAKLTEYSQQGGINVVFHCAALCDFKVKQVSTAAGEALTERKVSSRAGDLVIQLVPASKVISHLRNLFPPAKIIGWKYELDGTMEDALDKGYRQITENATDACVVNGRAVGTGFLWCETGRDAEPVTDKAGLVEFIARKLAAKTA
jgi:phosphopantothenoylcysteine synthetase/decarboxylase